MNGYEALPDESSELTMSNCTEKMWFFDHKSKIQDCEIKLTSIPKDHCGEQSPTTDRTV